MKVGCSGGGAGGGGGATVVQAATQQARKSREARKNTERHDPKSEQPLTQFYHRSTIFTCIATLPTWDEKFRVARQPVITSGERYFQIGLPEPGSP